MPQYKSPTHDPGTEPVVGVLLVNLGTPDAPTGKALRPYLAQFLGDPRVIEYPRWLWQPLLHGVILNVRPRRSAELYASIWTEEGSPLLLGTQSLADKLQERLGVDGRIKIVAAMRYGRPSIPDALEELRRANTQRILVAPLFPQYSATTTATIYDVVFDEMKQWRVMPELHTINTYHTHPLYIQGIADSIRAHWQENGKADKLLLSFHGIPQSYADKGDPYPDYCRKSARLIAAQLGLGEDEYQVCFQSRFGPDEWLQPYTDKTLEAWAKEGVASVDTLCPGFAIDCLETLEEMAEQNKHIYLNAGGRQYQYIPCLNDSPAQVDLFADLIRTHVQGWEKNLRLEIGD